MTIDLFYDVAIAFARHGSRKPPNLEVETQLFLAACKRARETNPTDDLFHGRAIRLAIRESYGYWGTRDASPPTTTRAEEVWVTRRMVEGGVRFAAPQGWMTIRMFSDERARLLAQIERNGFPI